MATSAIPADDVTLAQTLGLLDGPFVAMTQAISKQQFGLWVGSGISRTRAPDLKEILSAAIEHLRSRVTSRDDSDKWWKGLATIVGELAKLSPDKINAIDVGQPFAAWPAKDVILDALWDKYADVLDVRIQGEEPDYLLWTAIDVRKAYGHLDDPDAEHFCVALLIMEGALNQIASANWDGLIEVAVEKLAENGRAGILQVVVDPADIRDEPANCRLVKFHGCAVSCVRDPIAFRKFLVATQNQVTSWRNDHPAVAVAIEEIAMKRALVAGLSLQDQNLQQIFSDARTKLPWPWPCAPDAQGHIFCEDKLGVKQDAMLKVSYKDAYNDNADDIKDSALLRARGKQALLSISIQVLVLKLTSLLQMQLNGAFAQPEIDKLARGFMLLRNLGTGKAPTDLNKYAEFVKSGIVAIARVMSVFRRGSQYPANDLTYDPISPLPVQSMLKDPNVLTSGIGWMAVAIALIGTLVDDGVKLEVPDAGSLTDGVLGLCGTWVDAKPLKIFLVSSAAQAVALTKSGAIDGDRVVVIHSDDTWVTLYPDFGDGKRSPRATKSNEVKHVSISKLVAENRDFESLRRRFGEEVTI